VGLAEERINSPAFAQLLDEAGERAREFEEARDIARDFHDKLKGLGLFRILIPEAASGLGGGLTQWSAMVRALSAADASVGWVVGHGAMTSAIISATADPRFHREYFDHRNATAAWSNLGTATAVEDESGIVIDGKWSFVTSSSNADYLGGVIKLRDPAYPSGIRLRSFLVPRDSVAVDRVWDPVGLAASGSHDIRITNVHVPSRFLFAWPRPWSGSISHDGDTRAGPLGILAAGTWPISLCCAATQLGIAERALREIRDHLRNKRNSFSGERLIENDAVLTRLESAEGEFLVCTGAFERLMAKTWQNALEGDNPGQQARIDLRLSCVTIVRAARQIVTSVFDCAGAAGQSRKSIFQKLLRDASCLTSHVSVSEGSYQVTGRARAVVETTEAPERQKRLAWL
jgi:alkylation response protein AidB-like acyl-CoA dehydrogenase